MGEVFGLIALGATGVGLWYLNARINQQQGVVGNYDYIITKEGNTTKAINGNTKNVDYIGTNDALVIQNALNAISSQKKTIILKGDFTIGASISIPSYTSLKIMGTLTRNGYGFHLLSINNSSNIEIEGGIVQSSNKNVIDVYDTNEINIVNSNDITIQNIRINNAAEDAIMVRGSSYNIKIDKCSIINSYEHAIDIVETSHNIIISSNYVNGIAIYDGITVFVNGGHTISITGNTVENIHGSAQSSTAIHTEDIIDYNLNNIAITGNSIYDVKHGITVANARPVSITGNVIRKSIRGMQIMHPIYSVISNNVINNTETMQENYGFYMWGATTTSFSGNTIIGNPVYTYGMYHQIVGGGAFDDCSITGNVITYCLYGIYNTGNYNVFSNNIFKNMNRNAIYVQVFASYNIFIGNKFTDNGQEANLAYDDIYVDSLAIANTYGLHFIGHMSTNYLSNKIAYHIRFSPYTNYMLVTNSRAIGANLINVTPELSIVSNNHL